MKDIFLVDADETLLDFCRAEREALAFTLRMYGVSADERLYSRYHAINDELWKALERGELTRERLVVKRFELLFGEFFPAARRAGVCRGLFRAPRGGGVSARRCGSVPAGAQSARAHLYRDQRGKRHAEPPPEEIRHFRIRGRRLHLRGDRLLQAVGRHTPITWNRTSRSMRARVQCGSGDSLTSDFACANSRGIDFILYCPQGEKTGYTGLSARSYAEVLALIGGL